MSKILKQRNNTGSGKILKDGWKPIRLQLSSDGKNIIEFRDKPEQYSSCIRCTPAPCIEFSEDEIKPSDFSGYPFDRNTQVCATDAITQTDNFTVPLVSSDKCILCGVCAVRCPVGAIQLVSKHGAIIEDEENDAFVEIANPQLQQTEKSLQFFNDLPCEGSHIIENSQILDEIFSKIYAMHKEVGDSFPNLLVRNLLHGAGIKASISRKGNVHMRMDMVFSSPTIEHGVVEVEFGQEGVMDAPRNILDDIAVLVSRYEWSLESSIPIIISDVLPNKRSEYWSVIQDIHEVLNVKINTITLLVLLLHNWNRKPIELNIHAPFYADRDTDSYRVEIIELIMERPLHLVDSPDPRVDIAK